MKDDLEPYADMLDLPRPRNPARPRMSLYNRAAQFSPYAALVGFDGVIAETARLTEQRPELSDWEKALLDRKLGRIDELIRSGTHPLVRATLFEPDPRKEGGALRMIQAKVRRVNAPERLLQFYASNGLSPGETIRIDSLQDLEGDLL